MKLRLQNLLVIAALVAITLVALGSLQMLASQRPRPAAAAKNEGR